MTIEDELRELMIKKSGSVNKFSQECGLSQSTIFTIFKRGVKNSNINSIIAICKLLDISADALADGKIVPIHSMTDQEQLRADLLTKQNYAKLLGYYEALLQSQKDEELK
jgi:DNA-binding Xre family transcriptional regulator